MTITEQIDNRVTLIAHVGLFFTCCDGDFDDMEKIHLKDYLAELNEDWYKEKILNTARNGNGSLMELFNNLVEEVNDCACQLKDDEKEDFYAQMEVFIEQLVNKDKNVDTNEVFFLNLWKENFTTDTSRKDIVRYRKWYNEDSFWNTIKKAYLKFGNGILKDVLTLYYALQDNAVPTTTKLWIGGALGYFILPIDLVPDILPGGWLDDIAFIAFVIKNYASNMPINVNTRAELKVSELKECLD